MNFLAMRRYSFSISALLVIIGLYAIITGGLTLGVDFTGGTILHMDMGREFTLGEVRDVLAPFGLEGSSSVQKVSEGLGEGDKKEVLIKTPELDPQQRDEVLDAFRATFNLTDNSILRVENVGAVIGRELTSQAFLAILLATIGMIIYITFRFEFRFAITAIIALLHDTLAVVAFFYLFRLEVNSPFVAAVLTIMGYSINDTIVIFDRIRENLKSRRKQKLTEIVNTSINQSLRRSIFTSLTTLFVLATLFIFGGVTLRAFISAMLVGVIFGTYSSIFVASPLWLQWKELDARKKTKAKAA